MGLMLQVKCHYSYPLRGKLTVKVLFYSDKTDIQRSNLFVSLCAVSGVRGSGDRMPLLSL